MNINIEKRKIIDQILVMNDEEMIKKISDMLSESDYSTYFRPLTEEEFISKIKDSEIAYEKGNFITQEALELEILTWKSKQ